MRIDHITKDLVYLEKKIQDFISLFAGIVYQKFGGSLVIRYKSKMIIQSSAKETIHLFELL